MAGWAFILGAFPSGGFCMSVDSKPELSAISARRADFEAIERFLASDIVKKKLKKFGLRDEEVLARLSRLSDGELHALAARVNKIHAGGDAGGIALAILLIVLIIVAILYFTDRTIKIEKKTAKSSQE